MIEGVKKESGLVTMKWSALDERKMQEEKKYGTKMGCFDSGEYFFRCLP